MSRWFSFVLGGAALLAAGVSVASPPVKADEKERDVRIVKIIGGGARLGATVEDVDPPARGAYVKDVQDGSAAAKAGLKSGDVIVKFDGEGVRSTAQLRRVVEETPPGRPVSIEVNRGAGTETLTATLERGKGSRTMLGGEDGPWADLVPPRMPEPPEAPEAPEMPPLPGFSWHGHGGASGGPRKLGIRFQEISGQLAQYFHLSSDEGILVVHVDSDSPASKAGIKAGDVVLKIAGRSVADESDLRHAVDGLEPGKEATVSVQRDGKPLDLKVTVGGKKPEKREAT
jgi:serine protease Do